MGLSWLQHQKINEKTKAENDAFVNHLCKCSYCNGSSSKYCPDGLKLKTVYDTVVQVEIDKSLRANKSR